MKDRIYKQFRRAAMTLLLAVMTAPAAWATQPASCLDVCTGGAGFIHVKGWAYDPDASSQSIDVHVYVYTDAGCTNRYGDIHVITANVSRPDVNSAKGITGNHGFDTNITIADAGNYWVKVFAIDTNGDGNPQISATTAVTVTLVRCLDECTGRAGYIHVQGWAYDPVASSTSIDVHVYVYTDAGCTSQYGDVHVLTANVSRPDVNEAKGITGDHGFDADISIADAGNYWVKVFAIGTNGNGNPQIGATTAVTVTAGSVVTLTSETINVTLHDGDVLTGTGGERTYVTIAAGATVTFSDVNITNNTLDYNNEIPSGIACEGDATIILPKGTTNTIIGCYYLDPCIKVGPPNTTLTIKGYGTLYLRSWGWGACIGGRNQRTCGNIVIKGGTLDLRNEMFYDGQYFSGHAACIGSGGFGGSCGDITISGGNISTRASFGSAAIGSGQEGTCGNITITGGTIKAKTDDPEGGAAIGGGLDGVCGNISISGVTSVSAQTYYSSLYPAVCCFGPGGGSGTCGTLTLWGQTSDYIFGSYGEKVLAPTDVPYTVRFNANGGTGSMADQGFYSNTPQALTANGFSLSGKAFKCWSTEADGSGYDFYNGETVTNLGNVTLYAQWANTDYVVSFEKNSDDAFGTMAGQNFAMNTAQALNANNFVYPGYAFAEWNTMQDGSGTSYTDKQAVSNLGNVTLYAQWTPTTYTITYIDAVNGTDNVTNTNPTNYAYMDNAITLAEPTRVGYTFDGWTYEGQDSPTKSVTIPQGTYGDWTFTAHWTESSNVVITEYTGNYQLQNGQTLSGTGGAYTHITIADGATVTLSGVNITALPDFDEAHRWAGITCLGDATIILAEGMTNNVKGGGRDYPGIYVPENKTLTIQGSGTLIANGSGSGGNLYGAAGIGSGEASPATCGNIVIKGGIITATGGSGSAGIGGGRTGDCGNITITGGTITANGGYGAPGIGSGFDSWSSCGDITITNGVTSVTAIKGTESNHSIGIGKGGTVGTITIGGVVTGGIPQSPFTYNPLETTPYTVTFDANGGEGTMDKETFTANTPQALTANAFTRSSYGFNGWNTAADGSGDSFADGQTVFQLGTMTLYAQWEPDGSFGFLKQDKAETMGTAARWYINMPTTGTITQTFTDAQITTFKVYDDGGKIYDYSSNCDGYLVLNAPDGYVIQLSVRMRTVGSYKDHHNNLVDDIGNDYLTVYDNSEASGTTLLDHVYNTDLYYYYDEDFTTVTSSGKSMTLYFHSNDDHEETGLNLTVTLILPTLTLANNSDNTTAIDEADGQPRNVALDGRTLYKDGDWNTLCLPFDVDDLSGTPLEGAVIKELDGTTSNLSGSTLTLNFTDATSIKAGRPYIVKWGTTPGLTISSDADWETFAANVNNGTEDYAGKIVKLAADISVTTMAGTESNPFKGIFDGDGHTLTLNITDESNPGTAPFRYISGATIINVKTVGTVTGNLHCAGLVGFAKNGTNSIKNCEVAANVVCSGGEHSHCGGILGHGLTSATTISDCLFSGTITGATTATGIIYGWGDGGGTHSIVNCLAAGTYTDCNGIDLLKKNGGTEIITNCYRKTSGGSQGNDASGMSNEDLVAALGSGWEIVSDKVVPKKNNLVLSDITNPVFSVVTISATQPAAVTSTDGAVSFVGTYSPVVISGEDKGMLYLGTANTLYYPNVAMTIGSCRAYFQLGPGLTVGDPEQGGGNIKEINLNFGNDDADGIDRPTPDPSRNGGEAWYSLDGVKLSGKPTQKGIYIHNGRKILK